MGNGNCSPSVVITMRVFAAAVSRSFVQRRGFASTARRLDNYAFVGLGQMGYQMAKNLQSKLQPGDRISIFDVNPQSMQGLEAEMKAASQGAAVELAAGAFDASKDADTVVTCLPCLSKIVCSSTARPSTLRRPVRWPRPFLRQG